MLFDGASSKPVRHAHNAQCTPSTRLDTNIDIWYDEWFDLICYDMHRNQHLRSCQDGREIRHHEECIFRLFTSSTRKCFQFGTVP